MKVLRSNSWKLLGYLASCAFLGGQPAFLFQHKSYEDVTVLKATKYVDVEHDKVFFFDAKSKDKVYVSHSDEDALSDELLSEMRHICEKSL